MTINIDQLKADFDTIRSDVTPKFTGCNFYVHLRHHPLHQSVLDQLNLFHLESPDVGLRLVAENQVQSHGSSLFCIRVKNSRGLKETLIEFFSTSSGRWEEEGFIKLQEFHSLYTQDTSWDKATHERRWLLHHTAGGSMPGWNAIDSGFSRMFEILRLVQIPTKWSCAGHPWGAYFKIDLDDNDPRYQILHDSVITQGFVLDNTTFRIPFLSKDKETQRAQTMDIWRKTCIDLERRFDVSESALPPCEDGLALYNRSQLIRSL